MICLYCAKEHVSALPCRARYAYLWQVPTAVAVTAALAQGGVDLGSSPPAGAPPFDELFFNVNVPAGTGVAFAIPAPAALHTSFVTTLGLDTADAVNTRFSSRINGAVVPPYNQETASPGPTAAPFTLPTPIVVPAGAVFDLFVENVSGADFLVSVRIAGFTI
jgi:hypothetical protein